MATYHIATAAEYLGRCNGTGGYSQAGPADTLILPDSTTLDCSAMAALAPVNTTIIGTPNTGMAGCIVLGTMRSIQSPGNLLTFCDWFLNSAGLAAPASNYGQADVIDGNFTGVRWRQSGVSTSAGANGLTFIPSAGGMIRTLTNCQIDTAKADCLSGSPGNDAAGKASFMDTFACNFFLHGTGSSDQWGTSHTYDTWTDHSSTFSRPGAGGAAASSIAGSSNGRIVLLGSQISRGGGTTVPTILADTLIGVTLTDCILGTSNGSAIAPTLITGCTLLGSGYVYVNGVNVSLIGCTINSQPTGGLAGNAAIYIYGDMGTLTLDSCYILGTSANTYSGQGVRNYGGHGALVVRNCYITSTQAQAVYLGTPGSGTLTVQFDNNICAAAGADIETEASAAITVAGGNNIGQKGTATWGAGSVHTGFAAMLHANAGIDANYLATPGGNCDGTGNPAAFPGMGGQDIRGRFRKLRPDRIDIGPAQRQWRHPHNIVIPTVPELMASLNRR